MNTRRPRSADTKARIVQAARQLLSEEGYERTTIRAVAALARIDPSMVMRYFGSKEGLFAAASKLDLRLPDLSTAPRAEIGERLVRHFLCCWHEDCDDGLMMLLRSAASNEEARSRMREVFGRQMLPAIADIVDDRHEAVLRAELVSSQILGLAFCRFVLEMPMLGGPDHDAIVRHVGAAMQMHLFEGQP